ncbi:MAG: hypothetical protein IIY94_09205 [Oscillospiraceae bacterium]|nr:hypothetical protein [Oscillospiraceae bacterium]
MEQAFSYMTIAFGAALLLYAGLLWLTKDVNLIPKNRTAAIRDPKHYAQSFALLILFLALAFISGGWVGLFAGPGIGAITMAVCLVFAIWLDVRLWKKRNKK